MIQTSLRYGLYSGMIMSILFLITWLFFKNVSFSTMEIFGYIGMIVSLCAIYFGIRHIRDKELNGSLSFKQGLLYGLLMAVIASFIFGIVDTLYIILINPEFAEQYYQYMIETVQKSGKSQEEIDKTIAVYKTQMENYTPAFNFFFMFGTVLIIGLIETIIFTLLLKRKRTPA